jgi:hypothetical protein
MKVVNEKEKIILNTAGMVEPLKEKPVIITDFSPACVGCVYSCSPKECSIRNCKYLNKRTKTVNKQEFINWKSSFEHSG